MKYGLLSDPALVIVIMIMMMMIIIIIIMIIIIIKIMTRMRSRSQIPTLCANVANSITDGRTCHKGKSCSKFG